jgi:peptidoglycan lytic transglycosylase G
MAVLIVLGSVQFFEYYRDRSASADIGKVVRMKVSDTDTTSSFARDLKKKGLIDRTWAFEYAVRIKSAEVIPGTYELRIGMSASEIADIVTGKSTPEAAKEDEKDEDDAKIITVAIPEGYRTEQIAEELVKQGWKGSTEEFMDAVENFDVSGYDFLESRDNPENPKSLEGFLFPDTYNIAEDAPPEDLIQKMLDNFGEKVTQDMRDRASQMNLSVYDVLIFASLVEREARINDERPIIADVYLNRYEQGMKFEADPTVQYAMGKQGDNWWPQPTGDDLHSVDSPYNTYEHEGKPPGPICNPGLASINAILQPGGTANLFFVLKDPETGEHVFAETYDEQLANQELYLNGGGGETEEEQPPSDEEVPIEQSGG